MARVRIRSCRRARTQTQIRIRARTRAELEPEPEPKLNEISRRATAGAQAIACAYERHMVSELRRMATSYESGMKRPTLRHPRHTLAAWSRVWCQHVSGGQSHGKGSLVVSKVACGTGRRGHSISASLRFHTIVRLLGQSIQDSGAMLRFNVAYGSGA